MILLLFVMVLLSNLSIVYYPSALIHEMESHADYSNIGKYYSAARQCSALKRMASTVSKNTVSTFTSRYWNYPPGCIGLWPAHDQPDNSV